MSVVEAPSLSFFFLSLSLSYTIRSEVKQAALQRVCSSLTPRLQTNSGQQDEERGGEEGGGDGGVSFHAGALRAWKDGLHRFTLARTATELLCDDLCMAGRIKLWLKW